MHSAYIVDLQEHAYDDHDVVCLRILAPEMLLQFPLQDMPQTQQ